MYAPSATLRLEYATLIQPGTASWTGFLTMKRREEETKEDTSSYPKQKIERDNTQEPTGTPVWRLLQAPPETTEGDTNPSISIRMLESKTGDEEGKK